MLSLFIRCVSIFILIIFLMFTPCFSRKNSLIRHWKNHVHHHHKHKHHQHAWHKFKKLTNAKKGAQIEGIVELKHYFHHFGYYHHLLTTSTTTKDDTQKIAFTNKFDDQLERVLIRYQQNYNLRETGTLSPRTLSMIMSPRCGVPDHNMGQTTKKSSLLHKTQHFLYFPGQPRWNREIPMNLTYAFSPNTINYNFLSLQEIRGAIERAFSKWASIIPVTFIEINEYNIADIKIGFHNGDHGDGEPFDGVLGVLAHAFSPENGRFHLDAAERWAVNFDHDDSDMAVDLESVALHEIGHLLGLAHSSVKEAVMYPSLRPREKKAKLRFDDIVGVQNLYGSNPNFTIGSLLESETSSSKRSIDHVKGRLIQMFLAYFWVISIMYFSL